MTSLRFDKIEPNYIIKIDGTVYLGGINYLPDNAEAVGACVRLVKRILYGNLKQVVVRKLRT